MVNQIRKILCSLAEAQFSSDFSTKASIAFCFVSGEGDTLIESYVVYCVYYNYLFRLKINPFVGTVSRENYASLFI